MALGLFATLIMGTILGQIGSYVPGPVGQIMIYVANIAKTLMGAGIGVGIAAKYKAPPLVMIASAVAGMTGAFPALFTGTNLTTLTLGIPGNPLSAFIAAYIAVEVGILVAGKTPVDIIVTPFAAIAAGAATGLLTGPYISSFTVWLGELINVNVEKSPLLGGILLSVAMGMILTLPISSAAIGVMLSLNGLAAGVATIGCCCQMVGFAVMSYKENRIGGLISQGIGTSMIQMPNILRHPLIWIPPILSSALLAPLSTLVFHMKSNAVGSGMGTSGLVGPLQTYSVMTSMGVDSMTVILEILIMQILLPGALTFFIAMAMRKSRLIKDGDLKLQL